MSGRANRKVVTSGRLTGSVRVSPLSLGAAPLPEQVYSLYSTDSEDQVTTLNKDLDQCADLLSGILEMRQPASAGLPRDLKDGGTKERRSPLGKKKLPTKPGLPRAVKAAAAKLRQSTAQKKAATKKLPSKTDLTGSGHSASRTRLFTVPAAHSGVRIHPPQKRGPSASPRPRSAAHQPPSPPFSDPPNGEEELLPVRDTSVPGCVSPLDAALPEVPALDSDGECCTETEAKAKTVRYLLEELKTLITVRGSVAERLLSLLEDTVSSLQRTAATPQHSRSSAHKRLPDDLVLPSEPSLRDELAAAEARLQQLQDDFTELRTALQDTQSQLRDMEAEKSLTKSDLEDARRRLLESEREKSDLARLAQQRLEEVANLKRLFETPCHHKAVGDSLGVTKRPHQKDPGVGSFTDDITKYLTSLREVEAPPTGHARPAAGSEGSPLLHHQPAEAGARQQNPERWRLAPQWSRDSVCSQWSARSESTFNTRDEVAFQDGLAALDASIANLQKTIQLDLRR